MKKTMYVRNRRGSCLTADFLIMKKRLCSLILMVCLILFSTTHLQASATVEQQTQKKISGTVKDQDGLPIPHAYVLVKGLTTGTVSDIDGKYEITVQGDVTLIFSFLGYTSLEIPTKNKTVIDVTLQEDSQFLDEVVVTGFNLVEKKHVTSSIVSVDVDKLQRRPIFKLQEAFAGAVSGVVLSQGNNQPGDAGSISIRGLGTLKSSSPLVIVDGIEQSMSDIDPNQIKSMSVLKDASASAMYGSRGANGVIVIETMRGNTGEFKVHVNTWAAFQKQTDAPSFVGAADYMKLNNEARGYQHQTQLLFTAEQIAAAERGEGANVNWLDAVQPKTAHAYNANASISGGGGVGTFNLMLGYMNENGLNKYEGTEKFSARFNTNVNLADRFILLADFYAHRLQVDRLQRYEGGHALYEEAWKMNPTQDIFYPHTDGIDIDKHYALYNNMNPVAGMNEGGKRNNMHDRITINLRPRYYISDQFHLAADMSYMINKSANKWERKTFKFYDGNGKPVDIWGHDVGSSQGVSTSQLTARLLTNYESNLRGGKDKLYLVGGGEIMTTTYTDYREENKASFFGKANYSFDDRYLFEVTVRGDGSSKFAPGHQWGVFPSTSVGWNVHNESFLSSLKEKHVLDLLKFRFSYGKIGNEDTSPYLWQEIVNTWGWTMRIPNPKFSWEKQNQWNFGLDFSTLNNRLDLTFDIYGKHSYDLIYSNFPAPPLTGANTLETALNIGEVDNNGWEISASWADKVQDFRYRVRATLFDNKNEVKKAGYTKDDVLVFKDNPDKIWYRGVPIDNYYGYETDGYFQTQEEINNTAAKLPNTVPGDIKYIDRNNDGVINDDDKVILGNPLPRYNYSVSLDLGYKQWDLSVLGTGIGKRDGRLGGLEGYPVLMDGNTNSLGTPRKEYMNKRWTPDNPNSRFPRVWTGSSSNSYLSDVWISDASYFRVKSLQLGYTFPKLSKGITNLRVYFNAEDFLTITNWEGLEPERNGGGSGNYPKMATYSFGVQVTFF